MKSKYILPTSAHKADHAEIDRALQIEQGYIEQSVILSAAVALNELFEFGVSRIEQFAGLSYQSVDRYLKAPSDKWADIVREDCRVMNVPVDEELIAMRGRNVAPITVTPRRARTATPEQQKQMDDIVSSLFADARLPVTAGVQRLQMPGIHDVEYAKNKIGVERVFITNCFITACARVLHDSFGFGKKKVTDFAHGVNEAICDYFDLDPDVWVDLAEISVKRLGVKVKNGWIVGKERKGQAVPEAPELSILQNVFIVQSRTELLTDEQSRRKHRSWINNPQRKK